ncbi:TetR/AcrR family transcriptional regulator [Brevibacterium picturae]|uniref:TetR/AcrR family transcriptional regulator n=1 Tax=Brevibacterium picturae TaxID=260553 RepID=A0ABP4MYJ6_9MICO
MARPAKFTRDDVLDAAARAVSRRWRDTTIADVAGELDAPSGSIYHRFASRDDLLGTLWVREIERFHEGFLAAADNDDASVALIACALHIPRYCRRHPDRAIAMTLFRQADLVERVTAPELTHAVAVINDHVVATLVDLSRARFGSARRPRLELVTAACQEIPYGLVRGRIAERASIQRWIDAAVAGSAREVLAIGDD